MADTKATKTALRNFEGGLIIDHELLGNRLNLYPQVSLCGPVHLIQTVANAAYPNLDGKSSSTIVGRLSSRG